MQVFTKCVSNNGSRTKKINIHVGGLGPKCEKRIIFCDWLIEVIEDKPSSEYLLC